MVFIVNPSEYTPSTGEGCPVDSSRATHLCLWHAWCPALIGGKLQNSSFSISVQANAVHKRKGLQRCCCPSQSWLTSGGLRCAPQMWCYHGTSGSQPPPHRSLLLTYHCRCDWNKNPVFYFLGDLLPWSVWHRGRTPFYFSEHQPILFTGHQQSIEWCRYDVKTRKTNSALVPSRFSYGVFIMGVFNLWVNKACGKHNLTILWRFVKQHALTS